jgi:hypothetical protein
MIRASRTPLCEQLHRYSDAREETTREKIATIIQDGRQYLTSDEIAGDICALIASLGFRRDAE